MIRVPQLKSLQSPKQGTSTSCSWSSRYRYPRRSLALRTCQVAATSTSPRRSPLPAGKQLQLRPVSKCLEYASLVISPEYSCSLVYGMGWEAIGEQVGAGVPWESVEAEVGLCSCRESPRRDRTFHCLLRFLKSSGRLTKVVEKDLSIQPHFRLQH